MLLFFEVEFHLAFIALPALLLRVPCPDIYLLPFFSGPVTPGIPVFNHNIATPSNNALQPVGVHLFDPLIHINLREQASPLPKYGESLLCLRKTGGERKEVFEN